jgi:RimJ/RimL family protein N-acetyltransferase
MDISQGGAGIMLTLRPLDRDDFIEITSWPAYGDDMAQMDYALRSGGWLAEWADRPETHLFGAELDGELIAFTMLVLTAPCDAELRIAIRGDMTGRGLGAEIMTQTLASGFRDLGLDRIHLIVRKNNHRGISLYRRLGFYHRGEVSKPIQGVLVEFHLMDLGKDEFLRSRTENHTKENKP